MEKNQNLRRKSLQEIYCFYKIVIKISKGEQNNDEHTKDKRSNTKRTGTEI